MVNESEQRPEDEVTTTQEHPEETATTVSDEDEIAPSKEPPLTSEEVKERLVAVQNSVLDAAGNLYTSTKDSWFTPARREVRNVFDTVNRFFKDLGGEDVR